MGNTQELTKINSLLSEAINEGLEAEVVLTALKAIKEDDTLSPLQAMQMGFEEWIK